MSEYTYKRQTAQDIKLSDLNEKAEQKFLKLMEDDIRKTVKELKDAGYTDEQINQGFNQATAQLFYGVYSYRHGGIVAADFRPQFNTVNGVRVCVNANQAERVFNTQELEKIKQAFGI